MDSRDWALLMTTNLHAHLLSLVDQSTPEGRALIAVLNRHAPALSEAFSGGGERRPAHDMWWCVTCQREWPCPFVLDIAKAFNVEAASADH